MDKKLSDYLKRYNIEFIEYPHSAVFTVEESKELKKQIPGMHCKTLFMKDETGKFYLIGMKADKRLNVLKLRKHFNLKKLQFASSEELKEKVNLVPGSVSIFGIINSSNVTLVIDKEVWEADKIGFHPNLNTSTLVLDHENLEKFYNSLNIEKGILEV